MTQETFIAPAAYIVSCVCVPEGTRTKMVVRTAERADAVTLTDARNVTYGEISNTVEPFDFTIHVFDLPAHLLCEKFTLRFVNKQKKTSRFFEKFGDAGVTELTPDRITFTTKEALIWAYDNQITVEKTEGASLAAGISYEILTCKNKNGAPVILYALHVAAGKGAFEVGTAAEGKIATVKEQAETAICQGKPVVAATNADFFDMFGNNSPSGLCVKEGRAIANPNTMRNFFGMDRGGRPVIGNFLENPQLYGQLWSAVGGREIFLRGGEIADFSPAEPFASVCHPRTAVGIGANGDVVVLVVDGRVPAHSNGASLIDLARVMQYFGMETAINLDGGGSSTFLVKEGDSLKMCNRPADLVRPDVLLVRKTYNALLITALS